MRDVGGCECVPTRAPASWAVARRVAGAFDDELPPALSRIIEGSRWPSDIIWGPEGSWAEEDGVRRRRQEAEEKREGRCQASGGGKTIIITNAKAANLMARAQLPQPGNTIELLAQHHKQLRVPFQAFEPRETEREAGQAVAR
jgi:hypothetical protein